MGLSADLNGDYLIAPRCLALANFPKSTFCQILTIFEYLFFPPKNEGVCEKMITSQLCHLCERWENAVGNESDNDPHYHWNRSFPVGHIATNRTPLTTRTTLITLIIIILNLSFLIIAFDDSPTYYILMSPLLNLTFIYEIYI